jgi:hypothetical protein
MSVAESNCSTSTTVLELHDSMFSGGVSVRLV